ncbi:hypothetical protein LUZ61_018935 [Rhynchospora tenuis]|uniref:F-box domain-containing protein n=1 Tax=Rhynchospora tenuis TaxID=198213 RepID=A0AAD5ZA98_9POAL|nr:hypothetical protein LUZ61_018935 [Rhynchospora tenuis]
MGEEGSPSEFPDWANLPQEIVHLISEKVKSIVDYVRFRAVCSSWRSASLAIPRHLPPQLPWLLIAHVPQSKEDKGTRLFYDLWESKMHKFRFPEISQMNCYASYRGWVMFESCNGSQVLLLNPLTRTRIQLPSFTTPVKHIPDDLDDLYWYMPEKVTFSADPTDPNCRITVFLAGLWGGFYCLVGDPCWTWVTDFPEISAPLVDITYYRGRFYLLYKGGMEIVEANKPEEKIICEFEPELGVDFMPKFLLEGNSEVYVVAALPAAHAHDTKEGTEKNLEPKIRLYQFQEQPLKLRQLTDTSNTVIFKGASWLTVCPDDWDTLNGGSLYKVDCSCKLQKYLTVCYTIYFCKLDDSNYKPVVCNLGKELGTEGIAPLHDLGKELRLRLDAAAPTMWFQPSFV